MTKLALGVQYNGYRYHGWQKQAHLTTIQGKLESALSAVAAHDVRVFCAGRTDTAVHASNQVIHFETTVTRDIKAWIYGTNTNLPHDIVVSWAQIVDQDFHARFKAQKRFYRYILYNHTIRPALLLQNVSWNFAPLAIEPMLQACQYLLGEQDFSSFRAAECQAKNPVKTMHFIHIQQQGRYIVFDFCANGFLHHMVRNIVGVLLQIGAGKQEPEWCQDVLRAKDRAHGGITAPPYGLYLTGAEYPEHFKISQSVVYPEWFVL